MLLNTLNNFFLNQIRLFFKFYVLEYVQYFHLYILYLLFFLFFYRLFFLLCIQIYLLYRSHNHHLIYIFYWKVCFHWRDPYHVFYLSYRYKHQHHHHLLLHPRVSHIHNDYISFLNYIQSWMHGDLLDNGVYHDLGRMELNHMGIWH